MDFVDRRLPFPNRSKMVVEDREVNGLNYWSVHVRFARDKGVRTE